MLKKSGPFVIAVVGLAYLLAVTQRSTMGVASLIATERFHTNAEQLSMLAVSQLIVYAGMQIPVGILLDRFGPRVLLTFGSATMSIGQFVVGISQTLQLAVIGRILVGFGDAFIFISMIRLINGWYQNKRASQLQQWMGNLGQLGQVLSAVPFSILLHLTGWTSAFLSMAALGIFIAGVVVLLAADERDGASSKHKAGSLVAAAKQLKHEVKRPQVRLAFWTHFCTQSSGTMLILLWGVPFLAKAQAIEMPLVSGILSSFVFIGMAFGFWYAHVCAHQPQRRGWVVTLMSTAVIGAFALVVVWTGQLPFWFIILFAIVIGAAGPSSMIAFDYSKEFVSKSRLGVANGFINIGGFLATFTMMFAIGVVLDVVHAVSRQTDPTAELYSATGFRFAFITVIAILTLGLWRFRVNLKKVFVTSEV